MASNPPHSTGPAWLARLTHRRWALPVLAELGRVGGGSGGCKLVWLERHLGAGRGTAKDALLALIELGLALPNPGYGHPMRPEYILTDSGRPASEHAERVLEALDEMGVRDEGVCKWALPVVLVVGGAVDGGARRFTQIRDALPGVTDRAVSQTLSELERVGVIDRRVGTGRPPRPEYTVSTIACELLEAVRGLSSSR